MKWNRVKIKIFDAGSERERRGWIGSKIINDDKNRMDAVKRIVKAIKHDNRNGDLIADSDNTSAYFIFDFSENNFIGYVEFGKFYFNDKEVF